MCVARGSPYVPNALSRTCAPGRERSVPPGQQRAGVEALFQDRQAVRGVFLTTWAKLQAGTELEAMESLIARVIVWHPEYHKLLGQGSAVIDTVFDREGATNPFLHMGLHIALAEQVQTDRPGGIRQVYEALLARAGADPHAVEHRMMDCLGAALWSAQRHNALPDPNDYLQCLRRL
jgi:hypothetical protein